MRLIKIITALTLSALSFTSLADSDWKLEKDTDGVKVYTRVIEGSPLKEFKGITHLKTSLTSIVALLDDRAVAPSWIKDTKESSLIKKIDASVSIAYNVTAAPWPVKDRDMVLKSVMTQNPETLAVRIDLNAEKDGKPEHKDRMRITQMHGYWEFNPQANGEVEVVYQVHADPAGSLPTWLVNSLVVDMPFHTLKNMQTKVLEEKYQKAEVTSIKNVTKP